MLSIHAQNGESRLSQCRYVKVKSYTAVRSSPLCALLFFKDICSLLLATSFFTTPIFYLFFFLLFLLFSRCTQHPDDMSTTPSRSSDSDLTNVLSTIKILDHNSLQPLILRTNITLMTLVILVVGLRTYTKLLILQHSGLDDSTAPLLSDI